MDVNAHVSLGFYTEYNNLSVMRGQTQRHSEMIILTAPRYEFDKEKILKMMNFYASCEWIKKLQHCYNK